MAREWRVCPGCGYTKAGACPVCFPALAAAERDEELAQARSAAAPEDPAAYSCGTCGGGLWHAGERCPCRDNPARVLAGASRSLPRRPGWAADCADCDAVIEMATTGRVKMSTLLRQLADRVACP